MLNVEIIVIGNEVLLGLVQDTNSNYLCRVIRGTGGRVRHVAVIRDESDAIASEVTESLQRKTDLIFTCGGLGPTDDDLTLSGIARALGLRLEVNETAREFVTQRYAQLARDGHVRSEVMNDARLKMATLPIGSHVIENPVGAAPASWISVGSSRIVSLPGVPAELKAIVEGPLQKLLARLFARASYRECEIIAECNDESTLAPILKNVSAAHTEVYVKSRAARFGQDVSFRILLSVSASNPAEAGRLLDLARTDLIRQLLDVGIQVTA